MSAGPAKIFIQVESSQEQQEHLKKSRKTFKVLQKAVGTDKENLAGRPAFGKTAFIKAKSENEFSSESTELKHKKVITKSTQTTAAQTNAEISKSVTEADLTSTAEPGEEYWKLRSEQQRSALEETLAENSTLHDRIAGLEEELNVSRQMLDEAVSLVEVLQELIQETETEKAAAANLQEEVTDDSADDDQVAKDEDNEATEDV